MIPNRRWAWVFAAAAGALLWRAAASQWPSSLISLPDNLRLPIASLGALFLICGVVAWGIRPNRWTAIFLLYGIGGAVHWGGAVGAPDPGLEVSLLFVYLAFSVLSEAAFLHLALIFPKDNWLAGKWRLALYAPAGLALLCAVPAGFVPRAALAPVIGGLLLVANLFSLVALGAFVVRLFRVDRATRTAARLVLIVSSIVISGLVALLGGEGLLPGQPDAWNLVSAIIPISLAIALVSCSAEANGAARDDFVGRAAR